MSDLNALLEQVLVGDLITAAEEWRDTMVRSNAPAEGYPKNDLDGVAHWATVNNHNGALVKAVDRLRLHRKVIQGKHE